MKKDSATLLEEAYDQYADAIFRHCYFRLLNRDRAKELMQDTFVKVWEYMQKGGNVENIRAFLYKIASNLIVDDVRKRKEASLDAMAESGFDPIGDDADSVTQGMKDKEVTDVLGKLKKEDRDLITMRYVDGFKPQEIAEMLGIPPNTASVRIHRAMQELKSLLCP